MVPEEGVEPTHPFGYGILSPARLPVPPLRLESLRISVKVPGVPLVESSFWNRQEQVEPPGTFALYRRVPVQVPEQVPPEKVPVIDRRSAESVALKV